MIWALLAVVAFVTVMNTVAIGLCWFYVAALSTVVNSHTRNSDKHWSSRWEDEADA